LLKIDIQLCPQFTVSSLTANEHERLTQGRTIKYSI